MEYKGIAFCVQCYSVPSFSTAVIEAFPGILGNRGKGIYFKGAGEQRPNFKGNRGTKTILGNRVHKRTNIRFFWEQGNKPIYFKGTGTPPPTPGRASLF